jgi:hypothetical protein
MNSDMNPKVGSRCLSTGDLRDAMAFPAPSLSTAMLKRARRVGRAFDLGLLRSLTTRVTLFASPVQQSYPSAMDVELPNGPVAWCVKCQGVPAHIEIAENGGDHGAIRFPAWSSSDVIEAFDDVIPLSVGPVSFAVWAEPAWKLGCAQAVAIAPEDIYVLLCCNLGNGPERLVLAERGVQEFVESLQSNPASAPARIHGRTTGARLAGIMLRQPFKPHETVLVLVDEKAAALAQTGVMGLLSGAGVLDFIVCSRAGIKPYSPVQADGSLAPSAGEHAGELVAGPDAASLHGVRGAMFGWEMLYLDVGKRPLEQCAEHHYSVVYRMPE